MKKKKSRVKRKSWTLECRLKSANMTHNATPLKKNRAQRKNKKKP
jgi:hypothetical protein